MCRWTNRNLIHPHEQRHSHELELCLRRECDSGRSLTLLSTPLLLLHLVVLLRRLRLGVSCPCPACTPLLSSAAVTSLECGLRARPTTTHLQLRRLGNDVMADAGKGDGEQFLLSSTVSSSSSRSRQSSFDDTDINDYFVQRPRRSLVARALRSLGFSSPRRMGHDELPGPARKLKSHSSWKSTRRSTISIILKRLLLLPLLILMAL